MADSKMVTKVEVGTLKENLKDMPINMRLFSLSMRSLYSDKAVGGNSDAAVKFRKLRDDTRQDGIVYLKCILPISTKFVMCIQEYFEYYLALSYEQWKEFLPAILEETKVYKGIAHSVVKMHEDVMVPLKKRQDEAKIIMKEFKELQQEYERRKAQLVRDAKIKSDWAIGLTFIPFVRIIATPVLISLANQDLAQALAAVAQSNINQAAALVVAETLIPALSNFIDGLTKAAGFFEVVEKELELFQSKAERGIDDPKLLHYKMMKYEAESMKSHCEAFNAALPAIRTDFQAIPNEDTDQNYVDKWLEKELAELEKLKGTAKLFSDNFFKKIMDA